MKGASVPRQDVGDEFKIASKMWEMRDQVPRAPLEIPSQRQEQTFQNCLLLTVLPVSMKAAMEKS